MLIDEFVFGIDDMKWSNTYATDVLAIDNDHRKLIELTDRIEKLISSGDARSQDVEEALSRLLDYTDYHFKREEELMREHEFGGRDEHAEEHKQFVGVAASHAKNWANDHDPDVLIAVVTYLKEWLIDHIMSSDQEMANHLKGQGIL